MWWAIIDEVIQVIYTLFEGSGISLSVCILLLLKFKFTNIHCFLILQQTDSERGRVSRTGGTSKRAVLSSSRPSSSGEPSENRQSKLGSGGGRLSTTQRLQPGFESKSSSFTRAAAARGVRDETLRSFELLTIGTGKRK